MNDLSTIKSYVMAPLTATNATQETKLAVLAGLDEVAQAIAWRNFHEAIEELAKAEGVNSAGLRYALDVCAHDSIADSEPEDKEVKRD